jgi:hypothetical protein
LTVAGAGQKPLLVGFGHCWPERLLHFAAALLRALTLNRQWHDSAEMSDSGITVPGMTEPPRRYDVTMTVDQDGAHHPNPVEFAVAAQQAASARAASITSAHTAGQIISVVTVQAADRPAAVAIALAVVSEALGITVAI